MDTRNRPERMRNAGHTAPVGMAMRARPPVATALPSWPQRPSFCLAGTHPNAQGECVPNPHPHAGHALSNLAQNTQLAQYERTVRARFDGIISTLKRIAALQHEADFEVKAQEIARQSLGFELPADVLADAWVTTLDMRRLYGYSVLQTFRDMASALSVPQHQGNAESEAMLRFFIACGFHEVDVSPCADGRLKGLLQYTLRLPYQAVRRLQSYAGAMFDVEANVKKWAETELRRYREGLPTLSDAGTRYLKIAVYHFSSSDPKHEGCAAHGSNELSAAQAALDRLDAFRTAIENGFCCGASVATLLIGVDTDTDAIKVHVPDATGQMSLYRLVDSASLFAETSGMAAHQARDRIYAAIDQAARLDGWGQGNGSPDSGMRNLMARLLENNCSQIQYVLEVHGGRYTDIGHNERFICVGEGFEELQIRNLTYLAQMDTVEEGAADLDVGIKIFTKLNISHGLPVPIAIHYRYDAGVPGAKERAIERCRRVKAAVAARYSTLVRRGLLVCGLTIQGKQVGSVLEQVEEDELSTNGH